MKTYLLFSYSKILFGVLSSLYSGSTNPLNKIIKFKIIIYLYEITCSKIYYSETLIWLEISTSKGKSNSRKLLVWEINMSKPESWNPADVGTRSVKIGKHFIQFVIFNAMKDFTSTSLMYYMPAFLKKLFLRFFLSYWVSRKHNFKYSVDVFLCVKSKYRKCL